MQKIQIRGRVTADPELADAVSRKKYTRVSVACNKKIKNKDGKEEDVATFYNVVLVGKIAEIYSKLKKGDIVFVAGAMGRQVEVQLV